VEEDRELRFSHLEQGDEGALNSILQESSNHAFQKFSIDIFGNNATSWIVYIEFSIVSCGFK